MTDKSFQIDQESSTDSRTTPIHTPGNSRLLSESFALGSFSTEILWHQLGISSEIIPDAVNSPPTPIKVKTAIVSFPQSVSPIVQPDSNIDTENVSIQPEKKQKLSHPLNIDVHDADFRTWTNRKYPGVYTFTVVFGDPEKTIPNFIKNCRKDFIVQQMIYRKFPEYMRQGLKSDLIRRLHTDLPSLTFQIDSREDLSRCLTTLFHSWNWPVDLVYNVNLPFRGSNVLGVKHYQEIFGRYFFDTKFSINNPNHMRIIRSSVRRELPRLSPADHEDLVLKISQNLIRGEVLSNVRQLSGTVNLSGHRYREINGNERVFYLDLGTLALEKGDKLEFKINYGGRQVFLLMRVDELTYDIPPLEEVSMGTIMNTLLTRAKVLKQSWHPFPKLTDLQFINLSSSSDEGDASKVPNNQLDVTSRPIPIAAESNYDAQRRTKGVTHIENMVVRASATANLTLKK